MGNWLRSNRWILLVLLLVLIAFSGGYFLWGLPGLFGQPDRQLLPVSLLSLLKANYAKEPMELAIPPMNLDLINNALAEGQSPTDLPERLSTLFNSLKSPVPAATLPGGAAASATKGITAQATVTPTLPISSTATPAPTSSSPTATNSPSQTSSPTPTGTVSTTVSPIAPKPTRTSTLSATNKPAPTNTVLPPTWTQTSIPLTATATNRPPTRTPLPPTRTPTRTKSPVPYPPPGPTPTQIPYP